MGAVSQDSLWREGMRPNALIAMLIYQGLDVRGVRAKNPELALRRSGETVVQQDTLRGSDVFCQVR